MKLTIKELAPYLPYGLKFISEMDDRDGITGQLPIWRMNGISFLFGDYCANTQETSDAYAIEKIKPFLRPLSDLTKPIEHNGETFVPFEELCRFSDYSEWLWSIEDDKYEMSTPHRWPYELVEKLIEWHFDIHGLIKAGLAIDLNTVNNPMTGN